MATRGAIILLDKKKTVAFYVRHIFEVVEKLLVTVDEGELNELREKAKEAKHFDYTTYVEETDPKKIEEFYNCSIPDPYCFDAEYFAFIEMVDDGKFGTLYDVTIQTSHFVEKNK